MADILPHSSKVKSDIEAYVGQAHRLANRRMEEIGASANFTAIYKTALATDAVLSKLYGRERPRLLVARSIIRRIPFFILLSQASAARVELRRLIEIVFLCVYFTDHPVEWESFLKNTESGIANERTLPITYCSHREPSYYANYAKERLASESSGIALSAAKRLSAAYGPLSSTVHAGSVSNATKLVPPAEQITSSGLSEFQSIQRDVSASTVLVLAGVFRQRFNKLPAVHRAWFDWLIGAELVKQLRSKPFGLP